MSIYLNLIFFNKNIYFDIIIKLNLYFLTFNLLYIKILINTNKYQLCNSFIKIDYYYNINYLI